MAIEKGTPIEDISPEEALRQVTIDSTIWPLPLWGVPKFRAVVRAATVSAAQQAINALGPQNLVARNLAGSDLGLSTRHWNEQTSGTFNAFEDSAVAANTTPDNTGLGLFGVVDIGIQGSVSAIRIETGGARPVEWDLQPGFNPNVAVGAYADLSRVYIAKNVLAIGPAKSITVRYYTRGASNMDAAPAELVLLGIVVEQEAAGSGLTGGMPMRR